MRTVLISILLIVVTAMIGVILLQKSEGGGLGIGGGGGGGFLSSRGTANVLTRSTAFLALSFFVISLLLSVLAGWDRKPRSVIQNTGAPAQQQVPGGTPTGQPGQGGGLLDTLRQREQPAAPPSGPHVPQSQ